MPAAFPPPWCVANVVGCSLSARTGSMKRRQFIALIGGQSHGQSQHARSSSHHLRRELVSCRWDRRPVVLICPWLTHLKMVFTTRACWKGAT